MLCISPKNYRKKDKILGHPNRYPNLTIIQFPYGDSSPTDYVGGGSLAMVAIEEAVRRENSAVVIFTKAGIIFFKEEESK